MPASLSPTANGTAATPALPGRGLRLTVKISRGVVLILSLLLIIFISYDTFNNIPFLTNHNYMTFQFWVCVVFMADFFLEFFMSREKKYYLKVRWVFFLISIPYLNIVNQFNLHITGSILFYIRFIPLLRGAYALATVLGYVSHNRAVSMMTQYLAILVVFVYSLALIFYYEEHNINPNVRSFWDALYFAAMNAVTVGCYFNAVTVVGKVISVMLPTAGLLILPLFTVVVTTKVQAYDKTRAHMMRMFTEEGHRAADPDPSEVNAQMHLTDDSPSPDSPDQ